MQESIVFLVRVQCRRKESSRSLSHLLIEFLDKQVAQLSLQGRLVMDKSGRLELGDNIY